MPFDPQMGYGYFMLMGLAVLYALLLDAWISPLILSSRILKVILQMNDVGQNFQRDERRTSALIGYIDSAGHSGRLMSINLLSVAYFILFLLWGPIAIRFASLTGVTNGLANLSLFFASILATAVVLWWIYRAVLGRVVVDANRRGFPFMIPEEG